MLTLGKLGKKARKQTIGMQRLVLAMSAIFCLLQSQAGVTKIIGEDSRKPVPAHRAEIAESVGMLFCEKKGGGFRFSRVTSATVVVNTETILASAHGFFLRDEDSQRIISFDWQSDCLFRKYRNGKAVFEARFEKARFGAHFGREEESEDWAVLRLSKPLTTARPLRVARIDPAKADLSTRIPIEIIAHHDNVEVARRLYYSSGEVRLAYNDSGPKRLVHDADTSGRASGGAMLFEQEDGKVSVLGVHSGGYPGRNLNRLVHIDSEILGAIREIKEP